MSNTAEGEISKNAKIDVLAFALRVGLIHFVTSNRPIGYQPIV